MLVEFVEERSYTYISWNTTLDQFLVSVFADVGLLMATIPLALTLELPVCVPHPFPPAMVFGSCARSLEEL